MRQNISEAVNGLRLAIVDEVLSHKFRLSAKTGDIKLQEVDFKRLGKAAQEAGKGFKFRGIGVNPKDDIDNVAATLRDKLKTPEKLLEFSRQLGEALFMSGRVSLPSLQPDAATLLIEVVCELAEIRGREGKKISERALEQLRAIDRKIQHFVSAKSSGNSRDSIDGSKNNSINTISYAAINKQHIRIALAIKEGEQSVLRGLSKKLHDSIAENPIFTEAQLKKRDPEFREAIKRLVKLGMIHRIDLPSGGKLYAYPHGDLKIDAFERLMPAPAREKLGNALHEELQAKYSGKTRRLGIAASRDEGVPSLLDKIRVHRLSEKTGLKPAHIVLGLKYFAQLGLLQNDEDGYILSNMGRKAGLGVAVTTALQRPAPDDQQIAGELLDEMLQSTEHERRARAAALYDIQSKRPGLSDIVLMDGLHLPSTTISPLLLGHMIDRNPELVVCGGIFSGDPAFDRKKVRNWAPNFKGRPEQFKLTAELFDRLGGQILHVSGRTEDQLAEMRAYHQVMRERAIIEGNTEAATEDRVRKTIDGRNNQGQYAQQQQLALEIAAWARFISLVVQPFEMKLGRPLYESEKIKSEIGLDMNELEIVRAVANVCLDAESVDLCTQEVNRQFGGYLEFVKELNSDFIEKLYRVVVPDTETDLLRAGQGEVVSRNGMGLNFSLAGAPDYKVQIVPDWNYSKTPRSNPTAAYDGWLRAQINQGRDVAPMHVICGSGELIGELGGSGAWVLSPGTLQDAASGQNDFFYDGVQDRKRRDQTVHGRPPQSSYLKLRGGGVHEGKITQAIEYQIFTPKLLEVLASNKEKRLERRESLIYVTSDQQIGSPTMREEMFLAGMLEAIDRGCTDILLNGDLIQGMNYLRYTQEAQLVKNPLNGIDSQKNYAYELLNPVLDYIWAKCQADPSFVPPVWRILPGNHETNSQSNKGLQGTWFANDIAEKIFESYAARLGRDEARKYVVCPEKFVDNDGTQVDYPMIYIDKREDTGICLQMTHYNASGAKGSSFAPTVTKVANAVHNLGISEPHIRIESHMHVSGFQVRNGIVCIRTGANASGSGFEQHLNYPNSPESNLFITLSSHDVPSFFVATRAYQETRYGQLWSKLHDYGLYKQYSCIEDYCEQRREVVSLKDLRNPTRLDQVRQR